MLQSLLRTTDAKDLDCPLSTITNNNYQTPKQTLPVPPAFHLWRLRIPPTPPAEKQNHFSQRSGVGGQILCIVEP